jgi:hypothetical protein
LGGARERHQFYPAILAMIEGKGIIIRGVEGEMQLET